MEKSLIKFNGYQRQYDEFIDGIEIEAIFICRLLLNRIEFETYPKLSDRVFSYIISETNDEYVRKYAVLIHGYIINMDLKYIDLFMNICIGPFNNTLFKKHLV